MATKLGKKNPWCKFMMMMTCIEVKGHQRSNVINYALWLKNVVRRIPCASLKWWWPSWRSKVKWGLTMRYGYHNGQKNHWCKFKMITFMEVKGHMWSHIVNYVPWLQNLIRRSVMTIMTCTEVKGQQRSNVLICYMATTFDQIYR